MNTSVILLRLLIIVNFTPTLISSASSVCAEEESSSSSSSSSSLVSSLVSNDNHHHHHHYHHHHVETTSSSSSSSSTSSPIPHRLSSPFGSYPNVLQITEYERSVVFHPIIYFPLQCWKTNVTITKRHNDDDTTANTISNSSNTNTRRKGISTSTSNSRKSKRIFICPAADFTSTSIRTNKQQLLSLPEFQLAQLERQRRQQSTTSTTTTIMNDQDRRQRQSPIRQFLQRIQFVLHDHHRLAILQPLLKWQSSFRYIRPTLHYYCCDYSNNNTRQYSSRMNQLFNTIVYNLLCRRRFRFRRRQYCGDPPSHSSSSPTETLPNTAYIGKYDEDRSGMYNSDLFRTSSSRSRSSSDSDSDSSSDSIGNRNSSTYNNDSQVESNATTNNRTLSCQYRSVHVGIDLSLGGHDSAGTPIYAFTNGIIHSLGYNPALGDYGNVIIVHHYWYRQRRRRRQVPKTANTSNHTVLTTFNSTITTKEKVSVYALYGHLSDDSLYNKQVNDTILRGHIIGRIGTVYENGGWIVPHLHFQLSTTMDIPSPPPTNTTQPQRLSPAPPQHDMPGAICYEDRHKLLYRYIDPRYVVGELH